MKSGFSSVPVILLFSHWGRFHITQTKQEEVSESGIDRNKDVIPSGLVYDGTEYPGTPY